MYRLLTLWKDFAQDARFWGNSHWKGYEVVIGMSASSHLVELLWQFPSFYWFSNKIFKLLKTLKVSESDLYQLNLEKFMHKHNTNILPSSFDNFFSKLCNLHDHGIRQQFSENFHHKRVRAEYGKNMLQCVGRVAWGCISNALPLPYTSFPVEWNCDCLLGIASSVRYKHVVCKMFDKRLR